LTTHNASKALIHQFPLFFDCIAWFASKGAKIWYFYFKGQTLEITDFPAKTLTMALLGFTVTP